MIYFPKCAGKGSFPKSQIKSLDILGTSSPKNGMMLNAVMLKLIQGTYEPEHDSLVLIAL